MLAKAMEVAHEHACSLNVTREITSQHTNYNLSSYSCKKKKKKKARVEVDNRNKHAKGIKELTHACILRYLKASQKIKSIALLVN